ncbi:proton-coupled folate transporter [Lingula anatina]|uniref:Proton-coupled folate transporter n=1 Tax=Lingula anatina TaxID=7574 RepID=A0A1S3JLP9_LINAN|nr:proton-coupled folate transporter [Lingula anatina]|eukprot:XP_013410834.1 proton-coupled folate transporter [Lingula anatina]
MMQDVEPLLAALEYSDRFHRSVEEERRKGTYKEDISPAIAGPRVIPKRKVIVEPAVLLYFLAGSACGPLTTLYMYQRVAESGVNLEQLIQQEAARWNMYLGIATMFPSVIATIIFGAHSDKAGRVPCILLPCIGGALALGINAIIIFLDLQLYYMLISNFVSGCFGGYTTLLLGSMAYVADTTTEDQRAFRIFVIDGMLMFGAALGEVGVGYWIHASPNFLWQTVAITVMFFVAGLYAFFFIPETVIKDPSARLLDKRNFTDVFTVYLPKKSDPQRAWRLRVLFVTLLFVATAQSVQVNTIEILYQISEPLCWTSVLVGIYLACVTLFMAIGGVGGLFSMQRCGVPDAGIAMVGIMSAVAAKILEGFATKTYMMFLVTVVGMLALLIVPMIRAMMSKAVDPKEQGTLFASVSSIETLCSLLANVIFNSIYSATVAIYKGIVFFSIAGVFMVAFLILVIYNIGARTPSYAELKEIQEDEETFISAKYFKEPVYGSTKPGGDSGRGTIRDTWRETEAEF